MLLSAVMMVSSAWAAEYHVSPGAGAAGDGSLRRPWSLSKALSAGSVVKPGDIIWLHGGVYTGGFECTLMGAEGKPIIIRPYRRERVIIDAKGATTAALVVTGQWTIFRDFEITDSDPDRTRERPHGMFVRGPHSSVINMVIHDCGVGVGFWSECVAPAEIYGCIIYNNGWQGTAPDRGHGHAIYTQNRDGVKRLADNVFFNQFSYGIHAYGSSRAFLKGFDIEGNAGFNNGCLSRDRAMTSNILVGGGAPAENIALTGNFSYFDKPGSGIRLGYGPVNKDAVVRGNYVVGTVQIDKWDKIAFSENTVIGADTAVRLAEPAVSAKQWDSNFYFALSGKPVFEISAPAKKSELSFSAWQQQTGSDRNSRVDAGPPPETRIFVRPNRHQPGRAHVIVFNWEKKPAVEVDLAQVLQRGQRFEIRPAQDYFGPPVLRGTYAGRLVRLPMLARPPAPPIGRVPSPPLATGPQFDVFVVVGDGN